MYACVFVWVCLNMYVVCVYMDDVGAGGRGDDDERDDGVCVCLCVCVCV